MWVIFVSAWLRTHNLKQRPFKDSFSTKNFTSALLNCFFLNILCSKTKQLRSVLVKLLVLNECLNGGGLTESWKNTAIHEFCMHQMQKKVKNLILCNKRPQKNCLYPTGCSYLALFHRHNHFPTLGDNFRTIGLRGPPYQNIPELFSIVFFF